jgi:uncharacterized protein
MTPSLRESELLDEADIMELDELLSALQNDDGLRLDAAQGLLAALSVGPEPVQPERWLPMVLGKTPTMDSPEQAQRLLELLVRLKRSVDYCIEHYAFEPIFAEHMDADEEVHVDAGGWCEGFSMGIDLLADVWEAQMVADDSLIELLSPIVALGVDDGAFSEISDHHVAPLSEAEREDLMQQLPRVLSDVQHYWGESMHAEALRGPRQLH